MLALLSAFFKAKSTSSTIRGKSPKVAAAMSVRPRRFNTAALEIMTGGARDFHPTSKLFHWLSDIKCVIRTPFEHHGMYCCDAFDTSVKHNGHHMLVCSTLGERLESHLRNWGGPAEAKALRRTLRMELAIRATSGISLGVWHQSMLQYKT